MGDDLGSSEVDCICQQTKYPCDRYGHLLNPISDRDGSVIPNWEKRGTKLRNLTNPYGHLHFAVGGGDDFYCFDYATINAGPYGKFIILDSTINSETGHFIQSGGYEVMPWNTGIERSKALYKASDMVGEAVQWCSDSGISHTRRGWNQDPQYFVRAVARQSFKLDFQKYEYGRWVEIFTDRQLQHGGKRIDKLMQSLFT